MQRDRIIMRVMGAVLATLAIILLVKELQQLPTDRRDTVVKEDVVDHLDVKNPSEEAFNSSEEALNPSGEDSAIGSNDPQKDTSQDLEEPSPGGEPDSKATEEQTTTLTRQEDSQMFRYEELSQEIKDRITGVSYSADCDVPYEELRYVNVLYKGFDGETHTGELIVNKAIAQDIVDIFKELYEQNYPIEQMVLVDEYDADDNVSMAADNSSAFNYRLVDNGSGHLSLHSYGLAIDINPRYNPYIRKVGEETVISPENGAEYADRSQGCEYYIREGDICYEAFTSRGFTWGGDWKNSKDYQHFQKKLN